MELEQTSILDGYDRVPLDYETPGFDKYALCLDENNRILYSTFDAYGLSNFPRVQELPDGKINDYLYINNEYIYDPLPVEPEEPTSEERLATLEEQNEMLLECILEMSELLYE